LGKKSAAITKKIVTALEPHRAGHVIPASRGRAEAKVKIDKAIEAVPLSADIELAGAHMAELIDGDQNSENAVAKLRNIAAGDVVPLKKNAAD
jgi:hypothetical protein